MNSILTRLFRQPSRGLPDGIRWASSADAAKIASLWHEVWHETYSRHVPPKSLPHCGLPYFSWRGANSLFEHDSTLSADRQVARPTALVVEGGQRRQHGGIRGFAVVRGGSEIEQFYVQPEARGSGIAATLLDAAEDAMLERDCHVAHLVVAVRNLRALRFYEKHGWIETEQQQSWMSTAPWEPVVSPSLADAGSHGASVREGEAAAQMLCTKLKKFVGYDRGVVVPKRLVSYDPSSTE